MKEERKNAGGERKRTALERKSARPERKRTEQGAKSGVFLRKNGVF